MRRLLVWGLLLVGCTLPTDPGERIQPTAVTDLAAQMALACGAAHELQVLHPYRSLELYVAPTLGEIDGQLRADAGVGRRATVLAALQDEPRVWAHLFLHLFYALPGGVGGIKHPPVFAACGLYPL